MQAISRPGGEYQAHVDYARRVSGSKGAVIPVGDEVTIVERPPLDEWEVLFMRIVEIGRPQQVARYDHPPHAGWDGWRPTSILYMDLVALFNKAKGQLSGKPHSWDRVLATFKVLRRMAQEIELFRSGRLAAVAA